MRKTRTKPWHVTEYLRTPTARAEYLQAALEDGDPVLVVTAIGDIARASGMSRIAELTGLGRESLYKALSPDGNPELTTVMRVLAAIGLQLRAAPIRARRRSSVRVR